MNKYLIIVAAAAALAGCASAGRTVQNLNPFTPSSSFQKWDTNDDGVLSQREASAYPPLTQNFRRVDSNADGNVNAAEYKAATTFLSPQPNFSSYDLNGDGFVTEGEAESAPRGGLQEVFDQVDADGDGNVSPAEWRAATTNLLRGVDFGSLDIDGDGAIDENEAEKAPLLRQNFDRVDVNDDDQISRQEYQNFQRR